MNVVDNSLNTLNEAAFIVTKQGLIVFCNTPGIKMFGYKNFNEICNLRVKDLVPDDFAAIFPDHNYYRTSNKQENISDALIRKKWKSFCN